MTKYLITGGAGFIGANIVRRLIKENEQVFLIVEPKSDLWRLQDIISNLSLHQVSLTDFDQIDFLIKQIKPDIIFHLAAFGGLPNQQTQKQIFDVNFYGTVNLFNACKSVGFECFINTGSSSEYGIKDFPMKEDDVLQPVSDYGVSKAASTQFCLKEALFNHLPVYTVRPFAVYGDFEMKGRLIPSIFVNLLQNRTINLSSPHFIRDFIYIDDIVDFYINLSKKKPKDFYVFNAGTGIQTSIGQVIETIKTFYAYKLDVNWQSAQPRPWEPKRWQACMDRAKNVLDWQPKYSLEKGLEKSLSWFKQNLSLYEPFEISNQHYKTKSDSLSV